MADRVYTDRVYYEDRRELVCFPVTQNGKVYNCAITERALRFCFDSNTQNPDACIAVFQANRAEIEAKAGQYVAQTGKGVLLTTEQFPGRKAKNADSAA